MKTLRLIIFTLLFLPVSGLFASPYDMILAGDPVLEDLRYISLESGKSILSFTAPLAPHEVENFLNSIDESLLSPPAQEAFDRVKTRLTAETPLTLPLPSDILSISLNVSATFEAMSKFNKDISWYPLYPDIPALISAPIKLSFLNSLQLYVEPTLGVSPTSYGNFEYFNTNLPFGQNSHDKNLPLRAFIAAGGPWWNFQLGRDRLAFGTGISGNLTIADNPAFYEFMRLSLFSSFFKYSILVNQMPLRITEELYAKPFVARQDPDSLMMSTQRYYYLHRLDWNFFDILSVSLMEGLIVGNSALEIRYLNPFAVFHNFFSSHQYDYWKESQDGHMNGSFFSLEINWNIIKSLAAYGQFAMTQFALRSELKNVPLQPPNGLGFMGGLQYTHSFNTWGSHFYLECIYTDPYLYINSTPFASFIHMRSVSASSTGSLYYDVGYPRDTISLAFGTKFFNKDMLIITGDFAWLRQGEHAGPPIKWDWEKTPDAFNETTPTGTVQDKFIASVGAQWKPFGFLTFNAGLTGIFSLNNNHVSGSNQAGGQASFSVNFTY